jgi:hypothetical protein
MAEWRNGGMAEWRNGGMAEWHNVRYEIVRNQDTESILMPPWRSPSWLVLFLMFIVCYYLFFITHSSYVEHSIGRWAYNCLSLHLFAMPGSF